MQDLQKGISKPLQEMILSSGDEDMTPHSYRNESSGSYSMGRSGPIKRNDSQTDDVGEDDESEDEEEDDEDMDFGN